LAVLRGRQVSAVAKYSEYLRWNPGRWVAVELVLAVHHASVLDVIELELLSGPTEGEAAGSGIVAIYRDGRL